MNDRAIPIVRRAPDPRAGDPRPASNGDRPRHEGNGDRPRNGAGPRLTRRELEVLRLVSEGLSNRQAAKLLWVSDQTVKFHLANIYRKLGVRDRVEAAHWAWANGVVLRPAAEPATETFTFRSTDVAGLRAT